MFASCRVGSSEGRRSRARAARVLAAALVVGLLWTERVAAEGAPPSFELEDQWETKVSAARVFSGTVVLVGGDARATGERIAEWAQRLPRTPLFGLSNLDGVPFFVPRGSVRGKLRELLPKTRVLLDWDGEVYRRLRFPEDREVVVQVHDATGKLLLRHEGPPTAEAVAAVRQLVATSP